MAIQDLELEDELNVYTGLSSFNSGAIEKELEECKKLGADVEKIKGLGFNALQLAEIRKGLADEKVDVSKYLNPKLSWTDMEEMRIEMSEGIDMSSYRAQGFDAQQLYQIRKGIMDDVDVSQYAKKEYLADQMKQLRLGLEKKSSVPIIFYQNPQFESLQMREIRKGLEAGIDISNYAALDVPYMKMRAVRESAEDGLIFDKKEITRYTAGVLNQLHLAFLDEVDISEYVKKRFDEEQLEQIRLCIKQKLPIDDYMTPDMRGEAIKEIRIGLEEGIDVSRYADVAYGWRQMNEMRLGLEHQIDITPYCKPLYQADQMREIRLGIEEGLDISKFSSMMYTARDMRRIRGRLLTGDLGSIVVDDGIEGSVLDRTGGVSDQAVLVTEMLTNREAYMEVTKDKMLCWFTLPTRQDGAEYTEDIILTVLFKLNIRKGINREEIKKMVSNPKKGQKYLVAAGKEAVDGKDGHYEYFVDIQSTCEPEIDSDGAADFSNMSFINQVHVGDKIAVYHRATKGENGYNIFGEVSPGKNGKEIPILKGEGFMIMSDKVTYVAKVTGAVSVVDGLITIKKIMVVPEVRITDKRINYDGVVYVQGDVNSGSEIRATGDVVIGGHMESSTITSGGNVVIAGGATCPVRGIINAEGDVTAKFFEGVTIRGKSVSANYFINCVVDARGMVKTYGRTGVIYGGTTQSLAGISSATIGNKSGVKTVINLGAPSSLLVEYNKLQKQISREIEDLKALSTEKDRLLEFGGTGDIKLMQWKIKINAAVSSKEIIIKRLVKEKEAMEAEMQRGENAQAEATEMIYAGTLFVINGVAYKVPEDRKVYGSVVFKADAKRENVVAI